MSTFSREFNGEKDLRSGGPRLDRLGKRLEVLWETRRYIRYVPEIRLID